MLLALVIVAAIAEFLLLRVGIRAGGKAGGLYSAVYPAILFGGLAAYDLVAIIAPFALVAMAWRDRARHRYLLPATAIVVGVVVATAFVGASALGIAVVSGATGIFATCGFGIAAVRSVRTERRPAGKFAEASMNAFLASAAATTALFHTAWALALSGAETSGIPLILAAGEIALVAAALLAPLALRARLRPVPLAVATGITVLVAGLAMGPGILPLVAMWSLGISLFLPLPVYLAAAWCFAFAVADAASQPGHKRQAAALLFLALAGRTWPTAYNLLLAASAGAVTWTVRGSPIGSSAAGETFTTRARAGAAVSPPLPVSR